MERKRWSKWRENVQEEREREEREHVASKRGEKQQPLMSKNSYTRGGGEAEAERKRKGQRLERWDRHKMQHHVSFNIGKHQERVSASTMRGKPRGSRNESREDEKQREGGHKHSEKPMDH